MLEKPDYLKIGKRTGTCAACGKSFAEAERLTSVLVAAEEEVLSDETPAEKSVGQESADSGVQTIKEEDPSAKAPVKKAKGKGQRTKDEEEVPPSAASHSAKKEEAAAENDEENLFERRDYCPKCWQELKDAAYFSFWIGHRSAASDLPAQKLNKAERNIALAALFDSLAEREEEETDFSPHLFFLAHLLMKFKIFKWLPSGPHPETGESMLRFLKVQTGEEVFIRDIEMPDEMVGKIKEEVEAYLTETTGRTIRI